MNRWLVLIISFFLCTTAWADFNSPFKDFAPNRANQIFTDTSGLNSPLSASDTTVQQALETLSLYSSKVTAIIGCETSDPYCYRYSPTTLTLWMSSTQVHDWTITGAIEYLLLETGDFILLEDGTSKILLE